MPVRQMLISTRKGVTYHPRSSIFNLLLEISMRRRSLIIIPRSHTISQRSQLRDMLRFQIVVVHDIKELIQSSIDVLDAVFVCSWRFGFDPLHFGAKDLISRL